MANKNFADDFFERFAAEYKAKKLAEFGPPKMILHQGVVLATAAYEDDLEYTSEVFIDEARAQAWLDAFDMTKVSYYPHVEYYIKAIEVY